MSLTPQETWSRLLERARQELPDQTFRTWLEPTEPLSIDAAAADAVAQAPARVYNPLFIYGDTGVGKTHLMQAIAHELLARKPDTRITFIGTEQFTNELVGSIQNRTTHQFRRRFRETDLLLVDDVQFLKGKEATQEEFFHTFNALYEAGRQIVLPSHRPPSDSPGHEARLVRRFQAGTGADGG